MVFNVYEYSKVSYILFFLVCLFILPAYYLSLVRYRSRKRRLFKAILLLPVAVFITWLWATPIDLFMHLSNKSQIRKEVVVISVDTKFGQTGTIFSWRQIHVVEKNGRAYASGFKHSDFNKHINLTTDNRKYINDGNATLIGRSGLFGTVIDFAEWH